MTHPLKVIVFRGTYGQWYFESFKTRSGILLEEWDNTILAPRTKYNRISKGNGEKVLS
jgi:hypothetical protein